MEQLSLDAAPVVAPRRDRARDDHMLDHSRRPLAGCTYCIDAHELSRAAFQSRTHCGQTGHIFTGSYEKTGGNGAWARGTCPTCDRRVSITRPTKMTPWPLVGAHRP